MTDAAPDAGLDIFGESYRQYHYGDGDSLVITAPVRLFVLKNGSHRVIDAQGVTWRPSPGWKGLSWLPKKGEPAFVA